MYLLALFGPLDLGVRAAIEQTGLKVLDSAVPYGMLVKGDSQAIGKALSLCTTEGYRFIRAIDTLPVEARMSEILEQWGSGALADLGRTNLVRSADGGVVVRVAFYDGADVVGDSALLQGFFQTAPAEYPGAWIIQKDRLLPALKDIPDIAYLEPLSIGGLSTNIAVRSEVLDIASVWPIPGVADSGYEGTGVTILLNDFDIDKRHSDLCKYSTGCPDDPSHQDYSNTIITDANPPNQWAFKGQAAHATHVAGILAGRGWQPFQYLSSNRCLCRPRPEEGVLGATQEFCGEVYADSDEWDSYDNVPVKGAAPGASIVHWDLLHADRSNYDPTLDNITCMMDWGAQHGHW